jgi:phosphocarrier protein HPr|uniref:HPr family phosphocarrier protein n=1 Tax=Candidatus Planktophila sp. TaxID=2175601 RepID=UPI00404A2742
MKEFRSVVAAAVGLHARPAALFASTAKGSGNTVRLAKIVDGAPTTPVDGASVLRVMTLGVKCGDEVLVTVEGESEEETSAKLQEIVESNDH